MDNSVDDGKSQIGKAVHLFFVGLFLAGLLVVFGYTALSQGVHLSVDGEEKYIKTYARTVGEFLDQEGIAVAQDDTVNPSMDTRLYNGCAVTVDRAKPLILHDYGKKKTIMIALPSVVGVLAKEEIALREGDGIDTNLYGLSEGEVPYMKIVREYTELIIEQEEIPFSTDLVVDPDLPSGERVVSQEGQPGIKENKIKIYYKNDKEIARELLCSEIIKPPLNKTVVHGSTGGDPSRGDMVHGVGEEIIMEATAYTHTGNPTATGAMPKVGTVAVDPNVIPLGTKLYIEGYGRGTAGDVGGHIKGDKVDLFFETKEKAIKWGRRKIKVTILAE
ncbi:MAG: DUF348 domain-containing protein [Clostridia bacterium]|nr:DUF348 domain-containing protein [Clostridia bacterium]